MNRFDRLKNHINEHKIAYVSIGTGFLFAGLTYAIMRGRYAEVQGASENSTEFNIRPFSFMSNQSTITNIDESSKIVNVLERTGRGHPGYIVRCIETQEIFPSQQFAAETLNIPKTLLSGHLNGKFNDVEGYHFERIGIAIA